MDFKNLITFNLDVRGRYARPKTFHNTQPKFNKNIKKITNDTWIRTSKKIYVDMTRKELGYINKSSDLGQMIQLLSSDFQNKTFLEIGTFNGYGSTRCFVETLINRGNNNYQFFSLESNPDKFRNSKALYYGLQNIHILQEVINQQPQNDIFNIFPILKTDKKQQYFYQIDLNNMEFCDEFKNNDKFPDVFDVVLFNGSQYTDYNDFLTIKEQCRFIIIVDIKTNLSSKKIIETIQSENNKKPNTWKKFYEFDGEDSNERSRNHSFIIYFKT